jgi:hypothetical protein
MIYAAARCEAHPLCAQRAIRRLKSLKILYAAYNNIFNGVSTGLKPLLQPDVDIEALGEKGGHYEEGG